MTSDARFDYVIVGAGTAGCVLAARLSEDPDTRVCLLEAGGPARHPFIHVPALVGAAIARRDLTWGLDTEPQAALNNRRLPLPRGKVIGGSGSINGMAYHRGHPKDYDDWAAAGNSGWGWNEVLPYFLLSENNADRRDLSVHGIDGPIHVTYIPKPNRLNQAFIDAFAALGEYRHCDDFTGPDPEGYGLRQGTIHRGRRDSTASALLLPALPRPNLTVLTRTAALAIRIEAGRATGVDAVDAAGLRPVQASREVLLCAGAIHSPQLLMLSGIGPAQHLEALGIRVRADVAGVGANYHDHPAVIVALEMRDTTSYGLSWRTLPRALWNIAEYALARRGPLASNVFESTAFIRSGTAADRPDVQIAFQPARRNPHAFPLPLGHGFAMSVVNLYPRSRGEVRLASSDARVAPRVNPNLLADPGDGAPLLQGLKLVRKLCDAPAFAPYGATEVRPGRAVRSDAELQKYLREATATVHHPVGSCRMGSDAEAVVDPALRVRGIANLRIVDASVFPSIVGGNTNAPIVMVAEKAVDLITGRTLRGRHGG
ncbi:MAG TPA: GMC family oxidoreductase N-terminal domain-containing protein [Steroidobacteraceae bacterium]|nr:GMC family oxidoreductase N-terminal domain-containing protein [Steroidobacteraceae bacterium]